jgi:hypothetical protein
MLKGVIDGTVLNGVIDGMVLNGVIDGTVLNGVIDGTVLNGVIDGSVLNGVIYGTVLKGVIDGTVLNGVCDGAWFVLVTGEPSVTLNSDPDKRDIADGADNVFVLTTNFSNIDDSINSFCVEYGNGTIESGILSGIFILLPK